MRLRGLSVLSLVLMLVVFGLSALSIVSCRAPKTVERQTIRGDTLSLGSTEYETLVNMTQTVPGDTVHMMIPIQEIQNLPEGAAFSSKTGRTRLTLTRKGGSVMAKAETDSIGQTVSRYERKARDSLQRLNTATESQTLVKERTYSTLSEGVPMAIAVTVVGIITVFIAGRLIK